ncbi:MAG: hypothetical protein QOF58_3998 [Pseudonocardiales bacterium]|jgi:hypothetical protein|nr:hypothetical protein [Pseudonocardiales bacterium]
MGATTFSTYGEGADVATAFRAAIEDAQYEYGHRSYTGTIAEKDSYVVIDAAPRSEGDAEALAAKLLDVDDDRISDKWGPAGAIAVRREPTDPFTPIRATAERLDKPAALERGRADTSVAVHPSATAAVPGPPQVTGWLFFGWASC